MAGLCKDGTLTFLLLFPLEIHHLLGGIVLLVLGGLGKVSKAKSEKSYLKFGTYLSILF